MRVLTYLLTVLMCASATFAQTPGWSSSPSPSPQATYSVYAEKHTEIDTAEETRCCSEPRIVRQKYRQVNASPSPTGSGSVPETPNVFVTMDESAFADSGTLQMAGINGCIGMLVLMCKGAYAAHFHWNGEAVDTVFDTLDTQEQCGQVILIGGYASDSKSQALRSHLQNRISQHPCLELTTFDKHFMGEPAIRSVTFNLDRRVLEICDDFLTKGTPRRVCTTYKVAALAAECCQCSNK